MRRLLKRITGPWQEYFIAAYTVEFGDSVVGYAKISRNKPRTPWDETKSVTKVSSKGATAKDALNGAEAAARALIAEWGHEGRANTMPMGLGKRARGR